MDWILPEWSEPLAAVLPRAALRWMEIHGSPFPPNGPEGLESSPPLRLAVVKSEVASHIYTRPGSSADLSALVQSTPKMIGPTAFFTLFQTDFILVRQSPDPECQHWRESFAGDPDPLRTAAIYEDHKHLRPQAGPEPRLSQAESSVPPESVDWNRYDAVICHDLALPTRVVSRFPRIFWSYWIGETGTPTYKASYRHPLAGYHCFLNGGSRRWRVRPSLRPHVVEFPYIFQQPGDRFRLGASPDFPRSGVLLERLTSRHIPEDLRERMGRLAAVIPTSDLISDRLQKLHSSRYFLQMGDQAFWGNSFQEAVSAGCLAIADPATMPNNRSLLLPELSPTTWDDALVLVEKLEQEPAWREKLRRRQESYAAWLLCRRPLLDWLARYHRFREAHVL